jgi:hypothetical protein
VSAAAEEDGRYSVRLGDGKELRVKRDNIEEVRKFGAGITGGFLAKTAEEGRSKQGDEHEGKPQVLRPHGKKEGIVDGLKSLGLRDAEVPEWMKPSAELLSKVNSDAELACAANNNRILKAVDEVIFSPTPASLCCAPGCWVAELEALRHLTGMQVSKNPEAWLKYKDDPEISGYFMKMMGL